MPCVCSSAVGRHRIQKVLVLVYLVQHILHAPRGALVPLAAHGDVHAVGAGAAEHGVRDEEVLQLADERLPILVGVSEEFHGNVREVLVGGVEERGQGVIRHALNDHFEKGGGCVLVCEV